MQCRVNTDLRYQLPITLVISWCVPIVDVRQATGVNHQVVCAMHPIVTEEAILSVIIVNMCMGFALIALERRDRSKRHVLIVVPRKERSLVPFVSTSSIALPSVVKTDFGVMCQPALGTGRMSLGGSITTMAILVLFDLPHRWGVSNFAVSSSITEPRWRKSVRRAISILTPTTVHD